MKKEKVLFEEKNKKELNYRLNLSNTLQNNLIENNFQL